MSSELYLVQSKTSLMVKILHSLPANPWLSKSMFLASGQSYDEYINPNMGKLEMIID